MNAPHDAEMSDVRERVAGILEQAAEILDEYGWIQKTYYDRNDGRHCLLGALDKAAAVREEVFLYPHIEALRSVRRAVAMSIPHWNDAEGRTHDEVTDLLRTIAKDLRNQ